MSRAFVDNDQGYDASPRVYVNNMNTPHATVSLPERRQPNRTMMRGANGLLGGTDNSATTTTGGGGFAGSPLTAERGLSPGDAHGGGGGGGGNARAAWNRTNVQTTARGEVVHPNLQDVYNRIMRRLQRQMNYAELTRNSLAEQYGVDLELQCEDAATTATATPHDDGGEHDGRQARSTSQRSSNPSGAAAAHGDNALVAFGEDSRPASQSLPQPPSRSRLPGSTNNCSNNEAAGEPFSNPNTNGSRVGRAGGTSRLLQYKQQPLPTAATTATSDAFGEAAADARSDAEVEKDMAEQPCPHPLRLVVQHVLETLQKKMTLAENGSLRDCIVYSFESRALLDRLLKEIPLYAQYTEYGGASSGSAAAVQQTVSGVYQQLRKLPVLLPRGEYVEEAATGAIRAELVGSVNSGKNNTTDGGGVAGIGAGGRAGALSSAAATPRLPDINAFATPSANANTVYDGPPGQVGLPEIALPAGYGKSSRLAASAARNNAPPGSAASRSPGYGNRDSVHQQRSFRQPNLRDHLPMANTSVSFAADSFGDVSEFMASGYAEKKVGGGGGFRGSVNGCSGSTMSEAAAAHRATQLVSVGTITEVNGVTTVPQADYAALQQQVAELQAQLADAQQHRSALAEQLCEEAQYTDQKKRIIQYLRETLVRECNMLRTQLHHVTAIAPAAASSTAMGKGGYAQRTGGGGGGGMGSVGGPLKESSLGPGGLNTSTHSYARSQKPSATAVLSSSTTTGVSALLQQKSAAEHANDSGSLGSMYGGNYSVTMGGGVGRGAGRAAVQFRHGVSGNNNNNGGRVSPGFSTGVAGGRSDVFQAEVEAVHSLLDLALLAVEEEAVLPPQAAQQLQSGHGDKDVLRSGFRKNAKQQLDELRVDFEERQQTLKKTLLQQTAEHNYVVAEQQAEVARLRALTDMSHVRDTLQASVAEIRAELNRVRMHVAEQLHFFRAVLHSTGQGLVHRAALVDSTMSDNVALSATLNATRELIESANALFLPMLTREYECGYHPWPLKMRNTRDPLGHIIQLRFGTAEVVRLRDSLTEFGKLYVAMHQYVMGHAVQPESTRPATGRPLEDLCAALTLNPTSHTDVVFAARRCHDVEGQLRKRLARLQSRILWNAFQQRTYTDRSTAALAEAGIDPRTTTLPVARRLDALAQQRGDLLQTRVKLQRERSENAKELYRLWREKEIDIMEGYPTPQSQRNRFALLSSNTGVGGDGGATAANATTRTARLSLLQNRGSANGNGIPDVISP